MSNSRHRKHGKKMTTPAQSQRPLVNALPTERDRRRDPTDVADDPWLRDYLLRAYCINHGVDFETLPRKRLTITDAKNLLLKRVKLAALLAELDTRQTPPPPEEGSA